MVSVGYARVGFALGMFLFLPVLISNVNVFFWWNIGFKQNFQFGILQTFLNIPVANTSKLCQEILE